MAWFVSTQLSLAKATWLTAVLCGVLVGTVLLGSSSAPQATAVPDGSASGLADAGNQLWHQDSPADAAAAFAQNILAQVQQRSRPTSLLAVVEPVSVHEARDN